MSGWACGVEGVGAGAALFWTYPEILNSVLPSPPPPSTPCMIERERKFYLRSVGPERGHMAA